MPIPPSPSALGAASGTPPKSLRDFLRDKELEYMEQIIRYAGGNRAKAADLLGISRATLYRKLPEEGVPPPPEG